MWSLVNYKGGLLSISQEIAQAFNVNGLREVCIRWVDKQPVALDLINEHGTVNIILSKV